jgi:hypothetical protein
VHNPAIGDQHLQDGVPVLGLLESLGELLGGEQVALPSQGVQTLMIGTPAMMVFGSIFMPGIRKRSLLAFQHLQNLLTR